MSSCPFDPFESSFSPVLYRRIFENTFYNYNYNICSYALPKYNIELVVVVCYFNTSTQLHFRWK